MARHCNQDHGWRSTGDEREHWDSAAVQTFCATPGKQRYFIVDSQDEPTQVGVPEDHRHASQTIMQQFRELEATHRAELEVVDENVAQTDQTGWWKRTGWVEHLHQCNKTHLAYAARLPGKDETLLRRVAELVDLLIERCVKGLASLPLELRRWLRSAQLTEVDKRPMARLQNSDSQDRYASYFKKLAVYSIRILQSEGRHGRTASEDRSIDVDDTDADSDQGTASTPGSQDRMKDARRLFPWKEGQKDLARRLVASIEASDDDAEQVQLLLEFFETFIFHKIYSKPFESPLIHFLAVLGIDSDNDRLRTGNNFSYVLAGLVYCTRVVALESLLPSGRREQQGEADFEMFLDRRRAFLADGSMSPMSNMISLLAYGKHLALNHGNGGAIFWEKGDRVMTLHGMRIVMDQFTEMARKAITDAEDLFWEKLMWVSDSSQRFEIDLDQLHDDVTFRKRGAYFVTNPQNRLEAKWEEMIERMLSSPTGSKMQRDGVWQTRRVCEYLRQVDKFLRIVLFGAHNTGAQPARGTEVLSVRFKNGFLQDRNIFVIDGQIVIIIRYYKSQSQWDVPKVVPRFLPWRLGQLLALYLVHVQRLAERLSVSVGYGSGWGEYLWANEKGVWDTATLTRILKQRTAASLGVTLGTLEYRHAAVGIGRKYVGDVFARGYQEEIGEVEEPEMETDDPLDLSAGRGSAIGARRYAVPSDIVKHLSQRNIDTFRPLSESWHRFLGLASRKGDRWGQKRAASDQTELPEIQTPVAKRGRPACVGGLMTPATSSFRAPSSSVLMPPSTTRCFPSSPLPPTAVEPSVPSSPPLIPSSMVELTKPSPSDRERAIRKALGMQHADAIQYKSAQQEEALQRIIDGVDATLVVVLPTGGGKTLLFTAPACLEDAGMTIVVVPYRQLINETVVDAKKLGLDCIEWTHALEDPAGIVFVSADQLDDRFFDYAARMAGKGLLRRVFVDECHLAVTAHSWRPKMVTLSRLQAVGTPLIMLTATLPVEMELDLESTMSADISVAWIRARTTRATTKYVVRATVEDGQLMQEVIHVCQKRLRRLRHRAKMVVYCRTKDECEELAGELGCGFFYSGSPDNEDVIARWKESGGCVVATTALGTGVNYPGIEFVLHAGMPYGLIDFAQESGRAGRGGEEVDSLILLEKGWEGKERKRRQYRRQEWSCDEKRMLEFVQTAGCRRLVLANYFDREHAVDCVSGEYARCDRCGVGVTDWQRSQKSVAEEREAVEDALDQMALGCATCWISRAKGNLVEWLHNGVLCPTRAVTKDHHDVVDMSVSACDEFRASIRYLDGGRTCHCCGISQKLCRTREPGQGSCQWPGIAVPVIRMAMADPVGRGIIARAGYDGEVLDWEAYALWLGQTHRLRVWGELVSNSMWVIVEYLIYCQQEVGHIRVSQVDNPTEDVSIDDTVPGLVDAIVGDDGMEEIEHVATQDAGPRVCAREIGKTIDVEELQRLVDRWRGVCVVCKARGRTTGVHRGWRDCCGRLDEQAEMEKTLKVVKSIDFAAFSGCLWCYRPQAVCDVWVKSYDYKGRVKYTKKVGSTCQGGDGLREATAALLAFGAKSSLGEWRRKDSSLATFRSEMAAKHRIGEIEASGMCLYFYKWAW